jgi:hypothetical protein
LTTYTEALAVSEGIRQQLEKYVQHGDNANGWPCPAKGQVVVDAADAAPQK